MIVWIGPKKFRVVAAPSSRTSPRRKAASIDRMTAHRLLPGRPFGLRASRYFSVTISKIGPTFWAMPPWTSTRLSQICCRVWRLHFVRVDVMIGQEAGRG